jgi:hypothetical protein
VSGGLIVAAGVVIGLILGGWLLSLYIDARLREMRRP